MVEQNRMEEYRFLQATAVLNINGSLSLDPIDTLTALDGGFAPLAATDTWG